MIHSYFHPPKKSNFQESLVSPTSNRKILIEGVAGSSLALLVSEIARDFQEHQVFILPDRESALYFYHDLEKLLNEEGMELPQKQVHYFPSSYRRNHQIESPENANVKLRAEIVHKIVTQERSFILVSYPEAISEKLISRKYLTQNSFTLHLGEILPMEIFLENGDFLKF